MIFHIAYCRSQRRSSGYARGEYCSTHQQNAAAFGHCQDSWSTGKGKVFPGTGLRWNAFQESVSYSQILKRLVWWDRIAADCLLRNVQSQEGFNISVQRCETVQQIYIQQLYSSNGFYLLQATSTRVLQKIQTESRSELSMDKFEFSWISWAGNILTFFRFDPERNDLLPGGCWLSPSQLNAQIETVMQKCVVPCPPETFKLAKCGDRLGKMFQVVTSQLIPNVADLLRTCCVRGSALHRTHLSWKIGKRVLTMKRDNHRNLAISHQKGHFERSKWLMGCLHRDRTGIDPDKYLAEINPESTMFIVLGVVLQRSALEHWGLLINDSKVRRQRSPNHYFPIK